jgi:hypothetical protein
LRAGGRRVGTWSAEELAKGVNLASASAEPWEPGGPWHAQGQLLTTMTMLRDELEWAERDLQKFLAGQPNHAALTAQTAALHSALVQLQRALAAPVPTACTLRPVPATP